MTPALLERIIGPPAAAPIQPDWDAIASEYGIIFPVDYKALAERYTALEVYEFFFIYHPTSQSSNLLSFLDPQVEAINTYLERTRKFAGSYDPQTATITPADPAKEVEYIVHPEPGGLLPWGVTVNAQKCLWLTHEDPEQWTVVIGDDVWGWWHYKGAMTNFLADVISERVVCPVMTETFPEEWLDFDINEHP
jgi:hypothetical protein